MALNNKKEPKCLTGLFNYNLPSVEPNIVKSGDVMSYQLMTKRYSHWVLDDKGEMEYISETKIKTNDTWYGLVKEFTNKNTAIIVMDPWIDWADENLNGYFGKIVDDYLMPLIDKVAENGHPIIIFTNSPAIVAYNTKISLGLQKLVDEGKAVLLYHSDYDADSFAAYLKNIGVNKVIYTGFCSNMCVLFRKVGIPFMNTKVQTYFIPQCSGAIEHATTWETQDCHKHTTLLISQTQALLIEFDDIMNALIK